MLISVQTVQSTPKNTPDGNQPISFVDLDDDTSDTLTSHPRTCFVCNSSSDEPFVDLYKTVSAHSKTAIHDFVWKFLGGKPSVRNATADAPSQGNDIVCAVCIDMIDRYDAARMEVKQFKKNLCQRLAKTEAHFEIVQSQVVDTTPERRDDPNVSEIQDIEMIYLSDDD